MLYIRWGFENGPYLFLTQYVGQLMLAPGAIYGFRSDFRF